MKCRVPRRSFKEQAGDGAHDMLSYHLTVLLAYVSRLLSPNFTLKVRPLGDERGTVCRVSGSTCGVKYVIVTVMVVCFVPSYLHGNRAPMHQAQPTTAPVASSKTARYLHRSRGRPRCCESRALASLRRFPFPLSFLFFPAATAAVDPVPPPLVADPPPPPPPQPSSLIPRPLLPPPPSHSSS